MSPRASGPNGGLERFRAELDSAVVQEIAAWEGDRELGKLYAGLQAIADREKFLNTYAEVMIARYLLARDCRLRVEVLTPAGRSCDFEVTSGDKFRIRALREGGSSTIRTLADSSGLTLLEL